MHANKLVALILVLVLCLGVPIQGASAASVKQIRDTITVCYHARRACEIEKDDGVSLIGMVTDAPQATRFTLRSNTGEEIGTFDYSDIKKVRHLDLRRPEQLREQLLEAMKEGDTVDIQVADRSILSGKVAAVGTDSFELKLRSGTTRSMTFAEVIALNPEPAAATAIKWGLLAAGIVAGAMMMIIGIALRND